MPLDTAAIRREFPILRDGKIAYLDSAATAQKPEAVLRAMDGFYRERNANVHRGMHVLAEAATTAYENARKTVAEFIRSAPQEIVFTKNCTEAINLVARSWGVSHLKRGDTVVLSIMEHHSNVVPWLQLKETIGITVEWVDIDNDGALRMAEFDALLQKGNVKLVAMTGLSNVLGVQTPLKEIIKRSHAAGATVLVDAAQLIAHAPVDVTDLDCDFLAFSGHKLYGPTGIGVLYGKEKLLEAMPPFLGGGMMIGRVRKEGFTFADIPQRFEAGTPPIVEAVGLGAAIDWCRQYSWQDIRNHETELIRHAISSLESVEGLTILGKPECGCVSFTIDGLHPHDLTEIIGRKGVCLRAGHHCTQPLHERLGVSASTRLSVALYNNKEDMDVMRQSLQQAVHDLR